MNPRSSKKYVLTGGPGVGKSTLVNVLSEKGYCVIPETARTIIEEEQIKNSDALPWKNLLKFQEIVAERQLAMEEEVYDKEIFLDRGIIDGYAYCRHGNIIAPKNIIENARARYDAVFLLAPLAQYENDQIRKEDREFQHSIHAMINEAYKEFGYDIIHVPALAIHERVEFILKALKDWRASSV